MVSIVLIIGVVIAVIGVVGVLVPASFRSLINAFRSRSMLYVAAVIRIAIGIVLILAAPECLFPLGIRVLGILAIVAGAVLPFLKQSVVDALFDWMAQMSSGVIRSWALVAVVLGGFLIYAAS